MRIDLKPSLIPRSLANNVLVLYMTVLLYYTVMNCFRYPRFAVADTTRDSISHQQFLSYSTVRLLHTFVAVALEGLWRETLIIHSLLPQEKLEACVSAHLMFSVIALEATWRAQLLHCSTCLVLLVCSTPPMPAWTSGRHASGAQNYTRMHALSSSFVQVCLTFAHQVFTDAEWRLEAGCIYLPKSCVKHICFSGIKQIWAEFAVVFHWLWPSFPKIPIHSHYRKDSHVSSQIWVLFKGCWSVQGARILWGGVSAIRASYYQYFGRHHQHNKFEMVWWVGIPINYVYCYGCDHSWKMCINIQHTKFKDRRFNIAGEPFES